MKYLVRAIETKEIYSGPGQLITDKDALIALNCYHEEELVVEDVSAIDAIHKAFSVYQPKLEDGIGNNAIRCEIIEKISD